MPSAFGDGNEMLAGSLHGIVSENTAVMQATQDVLRDLKDSVKRMTDMLGNSAIEQMAGGNSPYGKGMPVYITNLGDLRVPGGHTPANSAIPYAGDDQSPGSRLARGDMNAYPRQRTSRSDVDRQRAENRRRQEMEDAARQQDAARNISISRGRAIGQSVGGRGGISLKGLASHVQNRMGPIGEDASQSQSAFGSMIGALSGNQSLTSAAHQGISAWRNYAPPSTIAPMPSAPGPMPGYGAGAPMSGGYSDVLDMAGASPGEMLAAGGSMSGAGGGAMSIGGAGDAAAAAGGAEALAGTSMLDAIPGVGEVVMGATAAFELFKGIGGAIAAMRAQGAQYQNIYGGTELGGLGQQGLQQAFALSQTGTLSSSAADKLFAGVSATGMQGGQRQNALNFAVGNYTNLGMSPQDSLAYIQQAAKDTSINLQTVANSLTTVTQAAAAAGVNADVARQSFQAMYTSALSFTGGNTAAITAAGATNYFTAQGRGMVGATLDVSSMAAQSRAAALMGYSSIGAYEAAAAKNPLLASQASAAIAAQVAQGNPAAAAIMAAHGTAGQGANGEYGAIHPNSALGTSLLNATPGGTTQMLQQLKTAGINLPANADAAVIIGAYANLESGGGSIVKAATQAQMKAAQANSRATAGDQNAWFTSHGGSLTHIGARTPTGGRAGGSYIPAHDVADTSSPLGHLLEMDRQRQLKYGQTQHLDVGGHSYTIQQLEQHKAALREAEAGHFGWNKPGPEASNHHKGQTKNGKKDVTLQILMQPALQNFLSVAASQTSSDVSLQVPVGNSMIPPGM